MSADEPADPPSGDDVAEASAGIDDTLPSKGRAEQTAPLSSALPSGIVEVGQTAGFDDTLVRSAPARSEGESSEAQVTLEQPGRYVGERQVGRGGLGRVLSTYDRHLAREVAAKELLGGDDEALDGVSGTQSQSVARFLREARVTAQLEHPNIVPVYELGRRADSRLYYTMKLVRGRTLKKAIETALDLEDRLALLSHFVDLCQAIAYAHSRGVIHRDIKPDNVMIGEFGETMVLDWGVAKLRGSEDLRGGDLARAIERLKDEDSARTLPGSAFGTPMFMSPEQASGRIDDVDERSDVWSLGVVLYQLLSGSLPYPTSNVYAVLVRVSKAETIPVREVCADAPPELVAVVERALSPAKEDRYHSAKELADEVEAFRSGRRVEAYEYSAWEVLLRFLAEHRAAVTVAGLAAVVVMMVLAGAYLGLIEERNRAFEAEATSRGHLADVMVERAQALERERDWVGVRLLAANALTRAEHPGARGLLLQTQDRFRPELRWQDQTYAGCVDLAFGPATEEIYCATSFGVERFDVEDGARRARLTSRTGWVRALALDVGGARLLTGSDGGEVLVWRTDTATITARRVVGSPVVGAAFDDGEPVVATEGGRILRLVGPGLEAKVIARSQTRITHFAHGADTVAWAGPEGQVTLLRGGKPLTFDPGHGGDLTALAVALDGETIATAGEDRVVRLFDAVGARRGRIRDRGLSVVRALVFRGRALVAGADDGAVYLLDPQRRAVEARFAAHEGPVERIAITSGGLVTAGRDRRVRVYAGAVEDRRGRLPDAVMAQAVAFALAPDADRIAVLGPDEVRLLSSLGPRTLRLGSFEAMALSTDGGRLALGGADGRVGWVDLSEPTATLTSLEPVGATVAALGFSIDGETLFTASTDGSLHAFVLDTGTKRHLATLPRTIPAAIAADAEGLLLARGGAVQRLRARARAPTPLAQGEAPVTALAVSPDGLRFASGDETGAVHLWRAQDGRLLATVQVHRVAVAAVALSEDGRLESLAVDGEMRVVDLTTLEARPQDILRETSSRSGVRLDGLLPVAR